MMKNNKDAIINEYIVKIKENSNISGSLLCGSYVTGAYNSTSDIDILLLSKSHKFEMILEIYRNTLFDRMIVDPELLINILKGNSILSNVLSLSFGLIQKVIIDSNDITKIISISQQNIKERNLEYKKKNDKPQKVIDGIPYLLEHINDQYFLVKNKKIIC